MTELLTSTGPDPERSIRAALRHNVRLDRVEYVPIDQLKTYGRRLRKRTDKGQDALNASVAGFGIVLPILIDRSRTIIGGEGIVQAAQALGYTEVPTLSVEHLDEAEVRLLRIALNKLASTSDWDRVELAAEFTELVSMEVDLAYEVTGFDTVEIDNLVHSSADPEADDPDDAPPPVDPSGNAVSRLGDVWVVGDHRVLCGSSLEEESLTCLMTGELARMVLTDAPYNVKVAGHVSGLGKNKHREFAHASGEMSEAEFVKFLTRSTMALASRCQDGALLYMFMDWRHIWEIMSGIRAAGLTLANMAVWVKRSGAMGSLYRSQHELCFVAKKGKAGHRNNVQLGRFGRNRTNCWFYPGVNSFGAGRDELLAMHPTSKNVAMLADAIRDVTDRGEVVLDGFLGSGSTLIAAERTGRRCRGIELDPLYVDVIVRRWEKATGRQVTLLATGETLEEVAARRATEAENVRPDVVARPRQRAA